MIEANGWIRLFRPGNFIASHESIVCFRLGCKAACHLFMPIVDVEIVGADSVANDLASRLADVAGRVFGSSPATTWVRVRLLPQHLYAENNTASPEGRHSVFVTVLKVRRPTGADLEAEVRALTEGIAAVCGRPAERVHILYEPDGQGRIAFGGRLKT